MYTHLYVNFFKNRKRMYISRLSEKTKLSFLGKIIIYRNRNSWVKFLCNYFENIFLNPALVTYIH